MRGVHKPDRVVTAGRRDALKRGQAGEGLVAEHVLAVMRCRHADLFLDAGRGGDVDRVDTVEGQHVGPGVEGMGDAMAVGEFPGRFHFAAGHRGKLGVGGALDHGRHSVGDAAGADDAPTQWFHSAGVGPPGSTRQHAAEGGGEGAGARGAEKPPTIRVDCHGFRSAFFASAHAGSL